MGLLRMIRDGWERFADSQVVSRMVPTWMVGRELPKPHDLRTLMDEGYRQNVVGYVCVREIATSAAEPNLRAGVVKKGELLPLGENHPLTRLLAKPNPDQDQYTFLEEGITHLESSGNWFIQKIRNGMGAVIQIWNLQPDRVTKVLGAMGEVREWKYDVGDGEKKTIKAEDVFQTMLPDPLNPQYGLAPIAVAARWGDMDNQAAEYLRAFFMNSGRPPGILKLKVRAKKPERERLKQNWQDQYGGPSGWHSVAVLDGDADYKDIGSKPDQLDLNSIFSETESRICAAYGVPPIVVGVKIGLDKSTFANYKEARQSLWQETLAPLYQKIGGRFSLGLGEEFGEGIVIRFDLGDVPALQEDLETRRKYGIEGWSAGLLMKNEGRELGGFERVKGGEVFLAPVNKQEVMAMTGDLGAIQGVPIEIEEGENGEISLIFRERKLIGAGPVGGNGGSPGKVDPPEEGGCRCGGSEVMGDGPEFFRVMHGIADEHFDEVVEIFLKMVEEAKAEVDMAALVRGIEAKSVDQMLAAIPWADTVESMLAPIRKEMEEILAAAGRAAEAEFEKAAGVSIVFDIERPAVVEWLEKYPLDLVREIGKQTQTGLKNTLMGIVSEGAPGVSSEALAEFVRDQVGLTSRQQGWVTKYGDALESELGKIEAGTATREEAFRRIQKKYRLSPLRGPEDLTRGRVGGALKGYQKNWLNYRAQTIGRTEPLRAAWQGQRQTWKQAFSDGLVKEEQTWRDWIVTPDDRLRADHAAIPVLNPNGVPFGEDFDTPIGPTNGPPFGTNCRCGESYRVVTVKRSKELREERRVRQEVRVREAETVEVGG